MAGVSATPTSNQTTINYGTPAATGGAATTSFLNADGSINYGALISGLGTAAGGALGANAAAGAQVAGNQAGIATQQGVQAGNVATFAPQTATGNSADAQLTAALTPGSGFSLSQIPGLTGAVNTAETAQSNLAASFGSLGNSGTPGQIGNYIAGNIALPAYNNYVQNLISTGQLGYQANQAVAASNLETGANISQEQQNIGNANASGITGVTGAALPLASTIGNTVNGLLGSGANASGVAQTGTALSGIGSLGGATVGGASTGLNSTSNAFNGTGTGETIPSNYVTGNTNTDLTNAGIDNMNNLNSVTGGSDVQFNGTGPALNTDSGYDFSSGF